MREIKRIPESCITREGSNVTVDVPCDEDDMCAMRFQIVLPFWSRVKVLFGWNPVVEHTVHAGLHITVGDVCRSGEP